MSRSSDDWSHQLLPATAQEVLRFAAERARALQGVGRAAVIDEAIAWCRRAYPEFFK